MSPQRPSKQKRAAQNRNERAARAARAANANNAPAEMRSSASASRGSGSLLSRLRGGQPRGRATTPSRAGGTHPATANAQPPGYRAALSALLAAGAAVLLCTFVLRYPVDARGDVFTEESLVAEWSLTAMRAAADQPDASAAEVVRAVEEWTPGRSRETVAVALWPFSLSLLLPLTGAALGFHAVRRRASSKVVNRALYATLFGAVLTQGLLMLFLPVVLAMGVAMFQVRKAETIAAATTAAAADESTDPGDAIEVDSVETEQTEQT